MSLEGQYIFNSLGFLSRRCIGCFYGSWFLHVRGGLVTTKSVSSVAAKIMLENLQICSLVFFYSDAMWHTEFQKEDI